MTEILGELTETCGFSGADLELVAVITAAVETAVCVDARVTGDVQQSTLVSVYRHTHTHTHVSRPFPGTTRVSRYQKGKTNLDFTETRDSEWQWNQLGHMQVCISLQTDNHANAPPLSFLQAGCPFCRPTNSVKALKA